MNVRKTRWWRRRKFSKPSCSAPYRPQLEVLESRRLLATVQWTGAGDGRNWDDGRNWSSNALPTSADDVIINVASSPTIVHRTGTNQIKSLTSAELLSISGGTLRISGAANLSNVLTLSGGTLADATVTASAGGSLQLTPSGGTLSAITVAAGTIIDATQQPQFSFNGPFATVLGGLTLHGTLNLGSSNGSVAGTLRFEQADQTLNGTGTVVLGSSINNGLFAQGAGAFSGTTPVRLTIGSGITIQGGSGSVAGKFAADSITNFGTIRVPEGGTVTVGGKDWLNLGTIVGAAGSSITLVGTMTLTSLGNLSSSGQVSLTGVLDNTGTTLPLETTRGSWRLLGGTILGGTIASLDGSSLHLTPEGGTLSGVTVAAGTEILATQKTQFSLGNPNATVRNGIIVHGTIRLGNADGTVSGELAFADGNQTLSGTGTIVFGSATGNGLIAQGKGPFSGEVPVQLTIGSNMTIQGGSGNVKGKYAEDSVVVRGTVIVPDGATLSIGGKNWRNEGTLVGEAGSTIVLVGSSTLAGLGNLSSSGTVKLSEVLDNTGTTLTLAASRGAWQLAGGTILGGTVATADGSTLLLTPDGGTLSAVTVATGVVLDATQKEQFLLGNPTATVLGGLVLHGTVKLGAAIGTVSGQLLFKESNQTLGGTGTIVFGSSSGNGVLAEGGSPFSGGPPVTLTIGSGIVIRGGSGRVGGRYAGDLVINQGTIESQSSTGVITLDSATINGIVTQAGSLIASNGGSFSVQSGLTLTATSVTSISPRSILGITGNLLSDVNESPRFTEGGLVHFQGSGTAAAPQTLEAMSLDLGNSAAGFTDNFSFGALSVSNRSYVRIVDQSDNSAGSGAEAVYVNALTIGTGATLDLNGVRLYARTVSVSGTVVNGTVTAVPDGGFLPFDTPVPGTISVSGQTDEWTIYGGVGRRVSVLVNPGTNGAPAPVAPFLNFVRISLLNATNQVLASANGTISGQAISLNNVQFPATGAYKLRISASTTNSTATGNYLVTAWDSTPSAGFLGLNEFTSGRIDSAFATNRWTFSAAANTQVQFNLRATPFEGLGFNLTGPNGFSGFTNLNTSSGIITLPASGIYTLAATSSNGAVGGLGFSLDQLSQTPLVLNTPFQTSFFGSGQSDRFTLQVTNPGPLTVDLSSLLDDDNFQFVGSRNQIPTRSDFQLGLFGGLSAHRTLTFDAEPGTYNFLLYRDLVTTPGSFSFGVYSNRLALTTIEPYSLGNSEAGTITVYGQGFDQQTEISFIAPDGRIFRPVQKDVRTPTLMVLGVDLPNWPAGTYDVQLTRGGTSVVDQRAFRVTQGGAAKFVARLGIPNRISRTHGIEFWLEYRNAGEVAIEVPELRISATDNAILTLDRSLLRGQFYTSTMPQGYSSTLSFPAKGDQATPNLLQPGALVRVPVNIRGFLQPWNESDNEVTFTLSVRHANEQDFHELQSLTLPIHSGNSVSMTGPRGFGSRNLVSATELLPFQIDFENPATARVPVQEVAVTGQLNPNLDWNSFQWTGFGFGSNWFTVPEGRRNYRTRLAASVNGRTIEVDVALDANLETGQLTSVFRSLDPTTQLPPSLLYGLLPAEDGTGRGRGGVSFIASARRGLATGTEIRNVTIVTFDQDRSTATDQANVTDPGQGVDPTRQLLLTVDDRAPASTVAALANYTLGTTIPVSWSGTDEPTGAGVASYDVFVSIDQGPFRIWLENTQLTAASYAGAIGHQYSFLSVATDNVGNREVMPSLPQATTLVVDPFSPPQDVRISASAVVENTAANGLVGILSTVDFNPNDRPVFELLTNANGRFVVVGNELRVGGTSIDFEDAASHVLQIKATNLAGVSLVKSITINVTNVNEKPASITLGANQVTENESGASVGSVAATDPDAGDSIRLTVNDSRFEIVDGLLRLKTGQVLDFETSPSIHVIVTATDAAGLSLDRTFTVLVRDLNERPIVISLSATTIQENDAGAVISTVTAIDLDAADQVTLSIDDPRFEIVDGQLRLKADIRLDFETSPSVVVVITATDTAGLNLTESFNLLVRNVNEPPESLSLAVGSVIENLKGAIVGSVTATDPDRNDVLIFRVDDSRFDVVNGNLVLKSEQAFDFESEPSVTVTLTVVDAGGLTLSKQFIIAVSDVNERPVRLTLASMAVFENVPGAILGNVTAADPDRSDVLTITVEDERLEVVDGSLRLKAEQTLDFETESAIVVVLRVTDQGGLSLTETATITVNNVNEPPVLTGGIPDQVTAAGTRFEYELPVGTFFDPDSPTTLTLSATRADGGSLPGWLTFDPASRKLLGTPTRDDIGELRVRVLATDDGVPALSASAEFLLTVNLPVNPHPWQNLDLSVDVDGDGVVAPIDALLIINRLNFEGAGRLPERAEPSDPYFDANGDDFCTPLDALRVINYLNGDRSEGESPARRITQKSDDEFAALVDMIAGDGRTGRLPARR